MPHLHESALLWAALVDRKDHVYLVRETLGRLWSRSIHGPQAIDDTYVKDMILLRTIFDIQRTRIRFNPPSRFALSVEDFLDCLDCLSQATVALCQSRRVDQRLRQILDISHQVFFSGFRAAALAIEQQGNRSPVRRGSISRLESCVSKWPLKDRLDPGRDWSLAIFDGLVDDLLEIKNSDSSCEEHIALDVPDRENFALTFNLSKCVPQAITCATRRCRYAYRSALVLLDLRLMLVAACFQYMNVGSDSGLSTSSSETTFRHMGSTFVTDEVTGLLEKCRALGIYFDALQNTDGGRSLSAFLNYISPGPSFGEDDEITSWMVAAIGVAAPSAHRITQPAPYQTIVEDLERRNLKVFDPDGPLMRIYNQLSEQIRTWTPPRADIPQSHRLESPDIAFEQAIYVLGCSDLHPIDFAMLADCIVSSGREVPEPDQDIIDVYFDCPFPHPENTTVRRARRVTPLCEIYGSLHKLVSLNIGSEDPTQEREDIHLTTEQLSDGSIESREVLSSDQGSTNSYPQPTAPQSPSMPSPSRSSKNPGFFARMASSMGSSTKVKTPIHRRSKSDLLQHSPHLQSALSPDASYLIVWSQNRIGRWELNSGNPQWQGENFLHDIILAAAGASHFATVTQDEDNKHFQLSLFNAAGKVVGTMQFEKVPQTLVFSHVGTKLAIATIDKLYVISTEREDWATSYCSHSLIPGVKSHPQGTQRADAAFWTRKVRRQMVSLSPDQRQVFVGTQYHDDDGSTLFWLFDIPERLDEKLSYRVRFARKIKVESSEPGLTALPCFHSSGQTTFIIGATSAHSHQPTVERIGRPPREGGQQPREAAQQIIGRNLSLDRMHRAIAVPGKSLCFVIVNEEANLYLVRRSSSRNEWEAEHVSTSISDGLSPSERNSNRLGVQIAASSENEIIIFYMRNKKGHLTRYNASDPSQKHQQSVPLEDFYPVATDPIHRSSLPDR
ncbi:hypothetical protein AYL99_00525 [Fonsecaea erecta]|uniref:Uncharacterized protein n=1 Tax=Fonsecaea erecta TaxID=1367422 RepID=A0A178ZZB3_9EURO|nr:hypothetical protein AYL99_00525 [Fonsecaea erecta]OAP64553.1 hypothetical protein AYL99_00525 [Fonsecaea erecta]